MYDPIYPPLGTNGSCNWLSGHVCSWYIIRGTILCLKCSHIQVNMGYYIKTYKMKALISWKILPMHDPKYPPLALVNPWLPTLPWFGSVNCGLVLLPLVSPS